MAAPSPTSVLMIGTGEYTTGYVGGAAAKSDKGAGVVGLVMFDLKRRGLVDKVSLAGVNGTKFPGIKSHWQKKIVEAYPESKLDIECSTFPADDAVDPEAYKAALATLPKGSAVTIFTPDDTHFDIAMDCIRAGMHVLITKPVVKTLEHHKKLLEAARENNVLVTVEVHKRWDPIYVDARDRIKTYGDFSFINAYMSQPKSQLQTFKAWAGKSSDISYYLNSHHIDFHEWCVGKSGRPVSVTASAASGVAEKLLERPCEDTISLMTTWKNAGSGSTGVAVYTSSWIAPKSDVHSQQRFHYMSHKGEVVVDQAHRGYNTSTDEGGYASCNPLFMKYAPTDGKFAGQLGYGYRSFEAFIAAVNAVRAGTRTVADCDRDMPTLENTIYTTAILEAGRVSLDSGGKPVTVTYGEGHHPEAVAVAKYE